MPCGMFRNRWGGLAGHYIIRSSRKKIFAAERHRSDETSLLGVIRVHPEKG